MSIKIKINRLNDEYLLECKNELGHTVLLDNKSVESPKGPTPMELLLMAIGGCNAIDIISILKKKRQHIDSYSVGVDGQREEGKEPSLYEHIQVTIHINGEVTPEAAAQAAELSFEKYCSVSKILEKTAKIEYSVVLNGNKI